MPIIGLDHVQVAAPRQEGVEDQARTFYTELLGMQEIEKPDALKPKGGVWFTTGAGDLHVGIEDQFNPARKAHPAFLVSDLSSLRATLEAANVPTADAEVIPNVNRFYVHDPFGNRIELIERL